MKMELGVNIPNFGPTATPENLRGWVRFAEDGGFAAAMISDHVAPTPDVDAIYPAPFYDPFATLAWLAGLTNRVQLGTSVAIVPYRHPLLTARLAANIDQFSGGRFILGVGVGWSEPEYTALGVAFHHRGRITDEYLTAITGAWAADRVSSAGEYVRYADVSTGPPPVRAPHPPIWVGGMSRAAIRRTVTFGDAWHPTNPDLAWLRDVATRWLEEEAADLGRAVPAIVPRIKAHLAVGDVTSADRPAGVGSLRQIAEDLRLLESLGCPCVILDTNPDHPRDRRSAEEDWRTLSRIAEAVAA